MLKRIFLIKETRNSPQNRKHTVRTSAPSPQWQENVRSYVPVLPNNAGLSRRSHPRMSSTLSAAASPDPHFHGKSTFRSHQTTDRSFRPDAVLLTSWWPVHSDELLCLQQQLPYQHPKLFSDWPFWSDSWKEQIKSERKSSLPYCIVFSSIRIRSSERDFKPDFSGLFIWRRITMWYWRNSLLWKIWDSSTFMAWSLGYSTSLLKRLSAVKICLHRDSVKCHE